MVKKNHYNAIGTNDIPILSSEFDKFGIMPYVEALGEFIVSCETPITIALQGGWGTGKTSFINVIDGYLAGSYKKEVQTFTFNTWQYSQFNLENHIGISFLKYLINEISYKDNLNDEKQLKKMFNRLSRVVSGSTINLGVVGFTVSENLGKEEEPQEVLDVAQIIGELKNTMQGIVNERIKELGPNGRIVIFIDDLDRLSPEIAVNLLEVIKLFVDVKGCVFVLAVDNKVIEEGVKNVKHTTNEKTKSFMEKMVQVPFKIPVEVYKYEALLEEKIPLFRDNKADYVTPLLDLIKLSVGSNPRAIKRLINYYTLNMSVVSFDSNIQKDINQQVLMLATISMQLSSQPLYILLLKNKNDEEKLLELIRQISNSEDQEFKDILLLELEKYNYGTVYDEDITINLRKYERFLQLLHELLCSLYRINTQGDEAELTVENLAEFIKILEYSETTNSGESEINLKVEKLFGEEKIITIEEFFDNKYNTKVMSKSIALLNPDKNETKYSEMNPKYAFYTIITDLLRDTEHQQLYLERLSNPDYLKQNNVPESVAKFAEIIEDDGTKYPKTTKIIIPNSDKKIKLGYHFNAEAGVDALYRVLKAVTEDQYDYSRILIKARDILS
ncbi:P-loop NTPase fold protein [Macrococcus equi]|uniref:KAP family P-loop NTPase fold protein n=1 Tax=Macrococcus equi TaxID=3395462 RepID=UPI0039BE0F6F